jgi:DNA-binding response OmpR family regulator
MARKILVVDDESDIRELLKNFLATEGYDVILAGDGEAALRLAVEENPDVIILDIRMPGIDGIETCRRLRATKSTSLIPVIVATALRDALMESLEAGADDFVTKPFHLVELSLRLKAIFRIRDLTGELDRVVAYIDELTKNLTHL